MQVGCSVPALLRFFIPMETEAQRANCITHDLWYTNGGTRRQRALADARFLLGLLETGMDVELAERYHTSVRLFGKPHWGPDGRYIDDPPGDAPLVLHSAP